MVKAACSVGANRNIDVRRQSARAGSDPVAPVWPVRRAIPRNHSPDSPRRGPAAQTYANRGPAACAESDGCYKRNPTMPGHFKVEAAGRQQIQDAERAARIEHDGMGDQTDLHRAIGVADGGIVR